MILSLLMLGCQPNKGVDSTKIEPTLQAKLAQTSREKLHLIIQFNEIPIPEEKENLTKMGIKLHGYILLALILIEC